MLGGLVWVRVVSICCLLLWWLVLFIVAWSSSQILSGKGCHNGQFEGGQLVQAILTKMAFTCQRLW